MIINERAATGSPFFVLNTIFIRKNSGVSGLFGDLIAEICVSS